MSSYRVSPQFFAVYISDIGTVSATDTVEEWLFNNHVDLILVIGTSGVVYPAAGYAWSVKMRGGKVAVFNIESDTLEGRNCMIGCLKVAPLRSHGLNVGPCEELLPPALGTDVAKLEIRKKE